MKWWNWFRNRKNLRLKEGSEVMFQGHNAVVLDHPYHIKYHLSGKKQLLNEAEVLSMKIIKSAK